MPGLSEPAVGRVTSLDPAGGLNRLHLRSGRLPEPGRTGEVLAGEAFMLANKLKLGDTIQAVINGRRQSLRVVGTALSPEYIYPIRPGEMLPDDRRFAVLWMDYDDLASAFDLRGAFNDVAVSFTPGASEPDVLRRIDLLTDPYGAAGAYGRTDQLSHKFISDELTQLRAMAVVAPAIFLAVAAFLLNIAIARLVRTQREQIAMLKAFGYTHWEVGLHYFKMVGVIVVAAWRLGAGRRLDGIQSHRPVRELLPLPVVRLSLRAANRVDGSRCLRWRGGARNLVGRAAAPCGCRPPRLCVRSRHHIFGER